MTMRKIDLHCYPNTEPWIKCQGPYVEALAKYWNRPWTWKQEDEVVKEFETAGVDAVLVALDLETTTNTPPCSNEYVKGMQQRHPDRIIQSWAAVDPFKGEVARIEPLEYLRDAGAEAIELVMWLIMRGALGERVEEVHRFYHVPASSTAVGNIILESR